MMKLEKDQRVAVGFLIVSVSLAIAIVSFGINDPDARKGLVWTGILFAVSLIYLTGGSRFREFADQYCRFWSFAGPDLSPRKTRWALILIALMLLIGAGLVYFAISKPVF